MYITAHSKWSWGHSTKVKLLGEAAHLLTVVSGHSCTTSFVFSSTRITDSLVIPNSRGTSLFLPFIFSCQVRKHQTTFMSVLKHLHRWFIQGANARSLFRSPDAAVIHMAVSVKPHLEEEKGSCEVTQQSSVLFNCCFIEQGLHRLSAQQHAIPPALCLTSSTAPPLSAHWKSITAHLRRQAYTWLPSKGNRKDKTKISSEQRRGVQSAHV